MLMLDELIVALEKLEDAVIADCLEWERVRISHAIETKERLRDMDGIRYVYVSRRVKEKGYCRIKVPNSDHTSFCVLFDRSGKIVEFKGNNKLSKKISRKLEWWISDNFDKLYEFWDNKIEFSELKSKLIEF